MTAIRQFLDEYEPRGKILLVLATIALIVDAGISYQYGITQTRLHAAGFALVAILFAILPEHAYDAFARGHRKMGIALAIVCLPVGWAAYYTHLGYGSSVRTSDISEARVQNTKWQDAREQVVDNKANLAMWRKRIEQLTAENAWTATVTADALRAKLPGLNLQIEQESKRGGCGPRCLAFTKERDAVQAQVAIAEEKADLTAKIEATQRLVDKYREASAATAHKESPIHNQVAAGAKIWKMVTGADANEIVNPDGVTVAVADIAITANGSLAFMVMAPIFFLLASVYRRREEEQLTTGFSRGKAPSPETAAPATPASHTVRELQPIIQRIDGAILSRDAIGNLVARPVQAIA